MAGGHFGSSQASLLARPALPLVSVVCPCVGMPLSEVTKQFEAILMQAGTPPEFKEWCRENGLLCARDIALTAANEGAIDEKIVKACKSKVVEAEARVAQGVGAGASLGSENLADLDVRWAAAGGVVPSTREWVSKPSSARLSGKGVGGSMGSPRAAPMGFEPMTRQERKQLQNVVYQSALRANKQGGKSQGGKGKEQQNGKAWWKETQKWRFAKSGERGTYGKGKAKGQWQPKTW